MKTQTFFLILLFLIVEIQAFAQIGFPYCETFDSNSTKPSTVFGNDAQLVNGALRLTSNQLEQRGFVYIDIPFSSTYGIKTSFEYFSYGGDGADGLAFFLFDAAVSNFSIGGFGGSLGYSKSLNNPGLAGAYLGVGFDEFGNFGNNAEGKTGGFPSAGDGLVPNSIVIRGPGNGYVGYEFIKGKKTMESGPDGLAPDQFFPISSGGRGTNRVTDLNQPGYRKVNLSLIPNPSGVGYLITLVMDYTVQQNTPRTITIFQDVPFPFAAPANLKLGFSASTGGYTNFHEIRNLIVEVANDEDLLNPIGSDIEDLEACENSTTLFSISEEDVDLVNENSTISCLQFYKSLEEIENISEDICEQAKCSEENRILDLEEGVFQATDIPGEFNFTPSPDFEGDEVTIYYTVTDNYGKRSQGNSLTVKLIESPLPMDIVLADGDQKVEEVFLCGGETVLLKGLIEVDYTKLEWRKDNVKIQNAIGFEYNVRESGSYTLVGYNENGCTAASNEIIVSYPEAPNYEIDNPIVGCVPGQSVDVTTEFQDFDLESYDYLLVGDGGTFENEQLYEVNESGDYELTVKPKTLDCYSNPIFIEVIILEEEFKSDFEFGVQDSGITGDADGGVFPDDVIQFEDLSDDSAVSWSWEFGDGSTSELENPIYTYGKKGEFQVVLSVKNELGCLATSTKTVSITKSYRVMFPNGFTPNQDQNKTFIPKFKGIISMEMLIFNIWGDLIFRTEDINSEGWNGQLDGKLLDAGTYVFRFEGVATDGEKVSKAGKFRLIR